MRYSRSHFIHFPGLLLAVCVAVFSACGGDDDNDPIVPPPNEDLAVVAGEITHADAGVGSVEVRLQGGPGSDRDVTTSNDGSYEFDDVEPGTWELEIIPPDYFVLADGESAVHSVTATEGETTGVDAVLAPAEAQEPVEISATTTNSFSSNDVTVAPGTLIRWINVSDMFHTVTPDDHSEWDRGTLDAEGDIFEAVVNNPGNFDYYCEPHQAQGMTGIIRVTP